MTSIRTGIAAVAATLLAAACSGDEAPPPQQRVTVTRNITRWSADGTKTTEPDATVASVAALVHGAGDVTRYDGAAKGAGTWIIPGVPAGRYTLEVRFTTTTIPWYFDTSADAVDLGEDRIGRAPVFPTASTPVTFQMTGLQPVQVGEWLQLYSADAGLWNEYATDVIAPGGTSAGITVDFLGDPASLFGAPYDRNPLLAAGDDLWAVQYRPRTHASLPQGYQTGVSFAKLRGATPDGVATTLQAAFTPVTRTGELTADWKTTEFAALLSGNQIPQHLLTISAVPAPVGVPTPALGGMSIDLFETLVWVEDPTSPQADLTLTAVPYGRFLPSTYREFRTASYVAGVDRHLPGTDLAALEIESVRRVDPVEGAPTTIAPRVAPVANVLLDGQDALTELAGVGVTPTISWDRVWTATSYEISVRELYPNWNGTTGLSRSVARFVTGETSFVVPAGVLLEGHGYVLRIRAREIAGDAPETAPLRVGLPMADATRVTMPFTP